MDDSTVPRREILWTPWRMQYITGEKPAGCVLCQIPAERDDAANLLLHRGRSAYVVLNRYPYNTGHLMIVPYVHAARPGELPDGTLLELMHLLAASIGAIQAAMRPEGFNVGMNLGRVAGAAIADHLHLHLVPRWAGDANFMTVIGEVRVLPEELPTTYARLRPALREALDRRSG